MHLERLIRYFFNDSEVGSVEYGVFTAVVSLAVLTAVLAVTA